MKAVIGNQDYLKQQPFICSISEMKAARYNMQHEIWKPSQDPFLDTIASFRGKTIRFFPKSGNLGDGFITYATYKLFEYFEVNFTTHTQEERFDNEIIVIGGGGNLIEGKYDDVATLIWEHRKTNKVYLLPQTIVGYDDIIKETFHNLTIFCRDTISFDHCINCGGNSERVSLAHDVTFYLNDDHFSQSQLKGAGHLNAFRLDGETAGTDVPAHNIDISLSWNGDIWQSPEFTKSAVNSMAYFLAQFETINTDRLHVSIMAAFLGRKVNMHPNNYYKNKAVHKHSIHNRFPNVSFIGQADLFKSEKNYLETPHSQHEAAMWKSRFNREQDRHSDTRSKLNLLLDGVKSSDDTYGDHIEALASYRRQLNDVYNSNSWKVTAPLRKIKMMLK